MRNAKLRASTSRQVLPKRMPLHRNRNVHWTLSSCKQQQSRKAVPLEAHRQSRTPDNFLLGMPAKTEPATVVIFILPTVSHSRSSLFYVKSRSYSKKYIQANFKVTNVVYCCIFGLTVISIKFIGLISEMLLFDIYPLEIYIYIYLFKT